MYHQTIAGILLLIIILGLFILLCIWAQDCGKRLYKAIYDGNSVDTWFYSAFSIIISALLIMLGGAGCFVASTLM